MKATIDHAGRLVIPKAVREEANLRPGAPLDVRVRDGVVEIEPEPLRVRRVRRGRLVVAVPDLDVPPLREATVERTGRALRRARRSD